MDGESTSVDEVTALNEGIGAGADGGCDSVTNRFDAVDIDGEEAHELIGIGFFRVFSRS